MLKKFFATAIAACACALAFVLPPAAFAAGPSAVYDGAEKAWHGEGLQQQDVLADFTGVMPGDTLVQNFELEVRNVEREVFVYMRPYGDDATLKALADIEFVISNERGISIAQGRIGDFTNQDEAIPIAAFPAADKLHLGIELYAPTTLGNEFQGNAYALEWLFIAQEEGEEGADSSGQDASGGIGQGGNSSSATSGDLLSKTNDASAAIVAVLAIVGIIAVAVIVVAIARLKGRSRR